ncbi:allantoate permease [Hysterangium stoloniferum]|nr:allantoate permease [Hysterangium stoloniferum]
MPSPASVTVLEDRGDSPTTTTPASIQKERSFVKSIEIGGKTDLAPLTKGVPRFIDVLFRRHELNPVDLDAIATEESVYDDPVLAPHFQPSPKYENLHRFDPSARWTYREERALVRKIDWRIMLWAAISYSALNLDRGNISNANSDGILKDLNLSTNDFNLGNTVFRLAFLCAELPSQLVSKRLGPDRWIPIQMCLWSIVNSTQFWLSGRTTFLVCRALLGLIQDFYKRNELPLRLACLSGSGNVCTVIGLFLAFGILRMRGINGKEGWRGFITFSIGVATFFQMPPSPTQSKAWFRPKGWFTEREEVMMVNRVLRDDPTKSDMHNRQGLNLKDLWKGALNFDLYPHLHTWIDVRRLFFDRFSTLNINLLMIPSTIVGLFPLIGITLLSELLDSRALVAAMQDVWVLPCLIALYMLPAHPNPWIFYTVASSSFHYHPEAAWASRNAGGVANRTINASLYNMFYQASVIVYTNIYREDDAPRYVRGNRNLIIICAVNIFVLFPGTRFYYMWRNAQREKKWSAMSEEEKSDYLSTTKDEGNQRLNFRFAY